MSGLLFFSLCRSNSLCRTYSISIMLSDIFRLNMRNVFFSRLDLFERTTIEWNFKETNIQTQPKKMNKRLYKIDKLLFVFLFVLYRFFFFADIVVDIGRHIFGFFLVHSPVIRYAYTLTNIRNAMTSSQKCFEEEWMEKKVSERQHCCCS